MLTIGQFNSIVDLVKTEKLGIRKRYNAAFMEDCEKWRKARQDGGHSEEVRRRRLYAKWVSESRKDMVTFHSDLIWRRHQQVGFLVPTDGTGESLIRIKEGKSLIN